MGVSPIFFCSVYVLSFGLYVTSVLMFDGSLKSNCLIGVCSPCFRSRIGYFNESLDAVSVVVCALAGATAKTPNNKANSTFNQFLKIVLFEGSDLFDNQVSKHLDSNCALYALNLFV